MIHERPGVAALVALILTVSLLPVPAAAKPPAHRGGWLVAQDKKAKDGPVQISRDQAAAIARSLTGGRVLSVKLKGNRYRIKVLVNGERVRTLSIDARTGAVK